MVDPKEKVRSSAFEDLFNKKANNIKLNLERMHRALHELQLTNDKLAPCILIGGTNGKGSTAGMLFRLLAAHHKIGLFTSPHLLHFSERIQVSHHFIDDAFLLHQYEALNQALPKQLITELTFFEITTLLAIQVFHQLGTAFNIFEVGLGGRLDATNAFSPVASAIVSIDFDHQQWLGNSIEEITREKLGIRRAKRPFFVGKLAYDEAMSLVKKTIASEDLFIYGEHFTYHASGIITVKTDSEETREYSIPLWVNQHEHRIIRQNYALSLALYFWLYQKGPFKHLKSQCHQLYLDAAEKFTTPHVPWPSSLSCRLEKLQIYSHHYRKTLPVYIDVCHNPAAIKEFIHSLKSERLIDNDLSGVTAFVSILADKDINGMLDILCDIFPKVVLFKVDHQRSLKASDLAKHHQELPLYDCFSSAWDHCAELLYEIHRPCFICGSLLAAGFVLDYFSSQEKAHPKHPRPLPNSYSLLSSKPS